VDEHYSHLYQSTSTAPRPLSTVGFGLIGEPGLPYQAASSLGTGPIPIGTRQLNLSWDAVFVTSVYGLAPTVFVNYSGVIDQQKGTAQASLNIPNIAALVGIDIHTAFVTVSGAAPSVIKSISNTFSFSITK